jgi:hypothetical protein
VLGKFSSRLAVTGATVAVLLTVTVAPAWAKPSGGSRSPTTGIDVSYPQCGAALPTGEAFAVVGVNAGLANEYSSCLADQWWYASGLTKTVAQAPAQTYLNTGDAGNAVADWPSPRQAGGFGKAHPTAVTSDSSGPISFSTPSGNCTFAAGSTTAGDNSPGCAYIYGYDMVAGIDYTDAGGRQQSVEGDMFAFSGATGAELYAQPVWLDVETGNSWQPQTAAGYAMNIADLQGMVDAVRETAASAQRTSAPIGIYSTVSQWQQVTGLTSASPAGNLGGLPVWIAGARTQKAAVSNCTQTPFTGPSAQVSITQWFGTYDGDYSCAG